LPRRPTIDTSEAQLISVRRPLLILEIDLARSRYHAGFAALLTFSDADHATGRNLLGDFDDDVEACFDGAQRDSYRAAISRVGQRLDRLAARDARCHRLRISDESPDGIDGRIYQKPLLNPHVDFPWSKLGCPYWPAVERSQHLV
jgi:hypothetical protein